MGDKPLKKMVANGGIVGIFCGYFMKNLDHLEFFMVILYGISWNRLDQQYPLYASMELGILKMSSRDRS